MTATKFDVGGYKLAAEISGEGSPTVVFISGSGDAGESWDAAISALRSSTTLMTYARAGIGNSEIPADPTPRSVGVAAEELRRLLAATDTAGPFILVGHSIGALIGLAFAAQWPENLAGLVLVDATDIHLILKSRNLSSSSPTATATGRATSRSMWLPVRTKSPAADAPSMYQAREVSCEAA